MMEIEDFDRCREPRARALIPFGVFLVFYLGISLWAGDFYRVPMPVAFLVASASALVLDHRSSLRSKVELFAHGMGNVDIMTMCLIFILAGAFAGVASAMGAVSATVNLALAVIPANLLLAGIFLVGCFISISIGTSVGTVVALTPIALGLTGTLEISPGLCLGAVVGGAMFGDNLSMISDTTIAATRTQGVEMRAKFLANLWIAIPAAVPALILYVALSSGTTPVEPQPVTWHGILLVLPYLAVLVLALCGMNVMLLILLGTFLAGCVGIAGGSIDLWQFFEAMGKGARDMSDTLIVALLAGGLLKVIRYNGGIGYLLNMISRRIRGRRGAELGIIALTAAVNLFTANNTVAIVIAGPIARDISKRFGVPPARAAGILDTASCIVQGILPYGAQLLMAVGLAVGAGFRVSASDVLEFLFYPYLLFAALLLAVLTGFPGRRSRSEKIEQ